MGKVKKQAIDAIIEKNYKSNEFFARVSNLPFNKPKWYDKAVKSKDIETISRSERKLASEIHNIGNGRGQNVTSFALERKETSTLTRYGDRYVLRQNVYTKRAGVWSKTSGEDTVWKAKKKAFK